MSTKNENLGKVKASLEYILKNLDSKVTADERRLAFIALELQFVVGVVHDWNNGVCGGPTQIDWLEDYAKEIDPYDLSGRTQSEIDTFKNLKQLFFQDWLDRLDTRVFPIKPRIISFELVPDSGRPTDYRPKALICPNAKRVDGSGGGPNGVMSPPPPPH